MARTQPHTLAAFLPPPGGRPTADDLLGRFLEGVAARDLTLYPAQEEAILELFEGHHVVLGTPTGSGKSLVAEALHFKALAEGKTSYYTCPIKALVNEKFFALCEAFGAERVGMMTGDATVNRTAPVICCTAEILASFALREEGGGVDYVIMDEFHYYADRDRGVAWQIPLISMPHATFLLMSATLGPLDKIVASLEGLSRRPVAQVRGLERPVPLDFEYRESFLHEAIASLTEQGMAPVYLVNFTQRAAAEQAQALTSVNLCSKAEKEAIAELLVGTKFDTPYGKEIQRYLRAGIGVHHAGILPKYRRLTERLAQRGLLKVVSGTDTLGMGINIPIRTVLFSQLCKFDGEKTTLLKTRDFQQIAGRAGRKGFDDRGLVVALAPEHVVTNLRLQAKAAGGRKVHLQKPPERGYVAWDRAVFERLQAGAPERLESRFHIDHGMLMDLLGTGELWPRGGYGRLVELIRRSHDTPGQQRRHLARAAQILRSLRRAGLVELGREGGRAVLRVQEDLQWDFSLFHTLSLFLVEAAGTLDRESETYALDLLTLVEAILETPDVVIYRQLDLLKGQLIARLKAEGVEYEERMAALEQLEPPRPNAEVIFGLFAAFAEKHPWIGREQVRPKSIARDLVERLVDFNGYVVELGLQRSEGVLLRYLSDVVRVLARTVPEGMRDEATDDLLVYLRDTVSRIDSSLLDEWEQLRDGVTAAPAAAAAVAAGAPELAPDDPRRLAADPRGFAARVRNELHRLLKALGPKDYEAALGCLSPLEGEPEWDAASLAAALEPFFAEHGALDLRPVARLPHNTQLRPVGPLRWEAVQRLCALDDESDWLLEAVVDLTAAAARPADAPLLALRRIGG
ncbi:MAG: DUF3516 domain-containing protein [Myxococcota bacterium]|jgi:superfamily II RNA helicase|nr:DUF3516 domain-containing protein [Myxococcota bacterium]